MAMFVKLLEARRHGGTRHYIVSKYNCRIYLKVFVKILKASRLGYRWAVRKHQDSRPLCLYR